MDRCNKYSNKTKQIYKISSFNLTPIQVSFKKNEGFFYIHSLKKSETIKPKSKLGVLVRTANRKKVFIKGDD